MAKAARVESGVMTSQARTAMSHAALCGLSQEHLGELTMEFATRWEARCESGRRGPLVFQPGQGAHRRRRSPPTRS